MRQLTQRYLRWHVERIHFLQHLCLSNFVLEADLDKLLGRPLHPTADSVELRALRLGGFARPKRQDLQV